MPNEPVNISPMRNRSESHDVRPPQAMPQEQVIEELRTLKEGDKLVIWYRPMTDFTVKGGRFNYNDDFYLDDDEVDRVMADRPLRIVITDIQESTWDDEQECDVDTYSCITAHDIDDDETHFVFITTDAGGIWSIAHNESLRSCVKTVKVDETTFSLNSTTGKVTMDLDFTVPEDESYYEEDEVPVVRLYSDLDQLRELRDALTEHLDSQAP